MSFNVALTGLNAANQDLSVTANNLANVGTVGFKGSRAEFADLYSATQTGVSATAVGNGAAVSEVAQQFSQGDIETTGNNLDLAISGNGFFTTSKNGALQYTRAGEFQLDKNGNVTGDAKKRYSFVRQSSLPTPGILVKGCLDHCNVCEETRLKSIELDVERRKLENELLQKHITLLEKSHEYRCCPPAPVAES